MKTPAEYNKLLKQNKLTDLMIAQALYSINKRAKNHRDKAKEYKDSHYYNKYDVYALSNSDNAREKMEEYYDKKEAILKYFKPIQIHKSVHNGFKTQRIYDYEEEYNTVDEDLVFNKNGYYDNDEGQFIYFKDIKVPYENISYYLYYVIEGYGFHSPLQEEELQNYKDLQITKLEDNFMMPGKEIAGLMSVQFCDKVLNLLTSDHCIRVTESTIDTTTNI